MDCGPFLGYLWLFNLIEVRAVYVVFGGFYCDRLISNLVAFSLYKNTH